MTPPAAADKSSGLRAVSRTADVLRALSEHRDGLTLTDLGREVGLPLSSVHRLVSAMDEEGFVRAQPRGRIFLGPLVTRAAPAYAGELAEEVAEVMRRLSAHSQETVDVSVREGATLRFVGQCTGRGSLRAVSSIGVRFPLHCTGAGKALLARLTRQEAASLLPARLPRLTDRTLTSRRALWRELEEVRAGGVGFDREEHHAGIASLATVVTDSRGTEVAVSLVAPAVRFYEREEELEAALRRAVNPLERSQPSARRKSSSA